MWTESPGRSSACSAWGHVEKLANGLCASAGRACRHQQVNDTWGMLTDNRIKNHIDNRQTKKSYRRQTDKNPYKQQTVKNHTGNR
eukprot:1157460-Pelagomonas_calceolata.AAC.7